MPQTNVSRKRPLSPSPNQTLEPPKVKRLQSSENRTRPSLKRRKPITSTKKAEEVSEKLASEIKKCIDLSQWSPENMQAAIKDRVLLALNVDLTRKRPIRRASSEENVGKSKKWVTCDRCSKTATTPSEMKYARVFDRLQAIKHADQCARKHQKRHTRPYGCTFPDCHRQLGSKNDWKRHENTQHYQIESWRCHEYSEKSAIRQCASVFHRREQFQTHLRERHQILDEDKIRDQCKRHHIGRNGQNGFWCGFCKKIVELNHKGLEAWEERFRHIDEKHYKKGQTIHEWVQLDKDVPEGVMGRGDYRESRLGDDDSNQSDEERSSVENADEQSSPTSALDGSSPRPEASQTAYAAGMEADAHRTSVGDVTHIRQQKGWRCVSVACFRCSRAQKC